MKVLVMLVMVMSMGCVSVKGKTGIVIDKYVEGKTSLSMNIIDVWSSDGSGCTLSIPRQEELTHHVINVRYDGFDYLHNISIDEWNNINIYDEY